MTPTELKLRNAIAEVVASINRCPTYQPATTWANMVIDQFKAQGGVITDRDTLNQVVANADVIQ